MRTKVNIGTCVPIILCVQLTNSRVRVTNTVTVEGEASNRVLAKLRTLQQALNQYFGLFWFPRVTGKKKR